MTLLLLAQLAAAAEYRRVELADGRVIVAEVQNTDANGIDVRVPQGRMHLSFDRVLRIDPAEAEAWAAQKPIRVLVLPFTAEGGAPAASPESARTRVWDELGKVPAVARVELAAMGGWAPATTLQALAGCGADAGCIGARVASLDVDVVIGGSVRGSGGEELVLAAAWPLYADVRTTVTARLVPGTPPGEVAWNLSRASLGLLPEPWPGAGPAGVPTGAATLPLGVGQAPTAPPAGAAVPPEASALAASVPAGAAVPPEASVPPEPVAVPSPPPTVLPPVEPAPAGPAAAPPRGPRTPDPALAFVPLPGFAQWVAGDAPRALAATAVVVPGTAGLVYLAGAGATRPAEAIALSAAGYYALCVVTGRAFVPLVTPTDGGLTMGVGGRF